VYLIYSIDRSDENYFDVKKIIEILKILIFQNK
jgi:hypothetical protein